MKKTLTFIISFLFMQFTAISQNGYSTSPESFDDTYNEDLSDVDYFSFDALMENNSDTTLNINWEITNMDLPIEWGLLISDKNKSYHQGPPITTNNDGPLALNPQEADNVFNISVYHKQISGCGSFDVLITLDESGSILDTIEYNISINDNDCLISAVNNNYFDKKIELFPNPFVDHLQINTESTIKHVTFYDLNGNALDTQLTNFQDLKVSNLESGIYFIEIVSANGQRAVKKIIKEK